MDILSIIAVVTGVVSLAVVIWGMGYRWGKLQTDIDNIKKSIKEISGIAKDAKEIADCCRVKIDPFWEIIKKQLPNLINVAGSGNLLEKLADDSITNEELLHLESEVCRTIPDETAGKPDLLAKAFSLWVIGIRKHERGLNSCYTP